MGPTGDRSWRSWRRHLQWPRWRHVGGTTRRPSGGRRRRARHGTWRPPLDLSGVKDYVLEHSGLLTGFTADFKADARHTTTWPRRRASTTRRLERERRRARPAPRDMKADWIDGNPYYERMEGIVAGTPSLAEYDVILDAGSSAAEDPESAVPFDLSCPTARRSSSPGNLYNLTEGALWGTLPDELPQSTPADLDGDGTDDFGEVLPDGRSCSRPPRRSTGTPASSRPRPRGGSRASPTPSPPSSSWSRR